MHAAKAKTPITLPVEVAAILWADAYRETLRPQLAGAISDAELAALDSAIERIERRIFEGKPKPGFFA